MPVEQITAAECRDLRRAVLRPRQPPQACVYPGDDAPDSFHVGVRGDGGSLIAVGSFYREALPPEHAAEGAPHAIARRIRGMAVLPEHRGRGLGRSLVEAGLSSARRQSIPPSLVWCNARTSAAGYYAKLGFTPSGDEFEIEGIGPHFVMVQELEPKRAVRESHPA